MSAIVESEIQIQAVADTEIFRIRRVYQEGSIRVFYKEAGVWEEKTLRDIGGGFVHLTPAPAVGTEIKFEYNINAISEDADLLQRVVALEERAANAERALELLLEAVDNRLPTHSFRVWIKALEKNLGKTVVPPNLFGIESVNPNSLD